MIEPLSNVAIIAGLLKVVDRLIDWVKHRQGVNKGSFTDFVAPAMADLEVVHQDYLDSFHRYRDMLEDKTVLLTPDHPILEAIRRDNLFSAGLRAKVLELDHFKNDPVFGHFMSTIKGYVSGATLPGTEESEPWDGRSQVRRTRYRTNLQRILESTKPESDKRNEAITALDDAVQALQLYYSSVVGEYSELKIKLLKPL
jgi:hypothetical protein